MEKSIFALVLILSLLAVGCQNSGTYVESKASPFCTSCKTETTTTFIKGLYRTKYQCPKCETGREYDDYSGGIIHTCKSCGRALEKCPICKELEGLEYLN